MISRTDWAIFQNLGAQTIEPQISEEPDAVAIDRSITRGETCCSPQRSIRSRH